MDRSAWIARRSLAVALALIASLGTAGCSRWGCSNERPVPRGRVEPAVPVASNGLNVLMVLVDTTRADHLGFMGYPRPTSPAMDAFARESYVYEHHYSHASRTEPSVASLFTGRYPGAHGVLNPLTHFDAKGRLSDDQVTLAERLQDAGYATYGVVTNVNVSARFGFAQGFDVYEYFRDVDHGRGVNEQAFELLDAHDPATGPFFMYLHYIGPHSPYVPDPSRRGLFADADYRGPITGGHGQLDEIVGGELVPSEDDLDQLVDLYDEDLRTFDDRFGELIAGLRARGLDRTTIVILLADHGEELWDHGSVLHGYTLYQEQLHVPLVIRHPGAGGQGRRVQGVSRHVDVLPTLLDGLHLPSEPRAQGASLVPMSVMGTVDPRTPVFAQVQLRAVKTVRMRSLQLDGWKLVESELPARRLELYDLTADPEELVDLAAREAGRVAELRAELQRLDVTRGEDEPRPEDLLTLTADELAQLQALGYVGDAEEPPAPEGPAEGASGADPEAGHGH